MLRYSVLCLVIMVSIIAATYQFTNTFDSWTEVSNFTYHLSEDIADTFAEEGLIYLGNDLDDPLLESRKLVFKSGMNDHTTKEVVRKLLYLDSVSNAEIDLYVSSSGGWYDSVFTIIDTFYAIDSKVNTICIGGCYSASALLVAAGTGKRSAMPHAHFSLHLSYGEYDKDEPFGSPPDRINPFYENHTNVPNEWLPLEDGLSYYFDSEQAKEFGIIDEVISKRVTDANY